ncbi:PLP-dependent transferase [Phanerochaete sordida]|uniref:PLP-dependent transferase n=1 Tax=Phanerochaete sordida TaxID=48140 RepID=A0A9P3G919_9APHY|nr:PLP-dependent transferase [Phanerochaete sordida]
MSSHAFRIAPSIQATSKPPIPQAYKWAEAYAATPARPLLDMSQGVPGIPPPPTLLAALGAAAADPASCGYVPNEGEPALRAAAAAEMRVVYGPRADVAQDDVYVTAGCNLAFTAAVMAVAQRGDEVVLPVPWYFNHEMTLSMLGIKPVWLRTRAELGFQPSVEECEKLITPATRAVVLVTPNNPTGAVYSPELIALFAALAYKHSLPLIIDETYRDFITTGPPHLLFSNKPALPKSTPSGLTLPEDWNWRQTLIHLFSFSKSYCIPGHRLGLIVASHELSSAVNTALDNIQICAPRPPQRALAPLLPSLRPFVRETAQAIEARHALFKARLPARWHGGSQGAYYAFVRHPFKGVDAAEVCRRLAQEIGVLCLPAGFFGPGQEGRAEGGMEKWVRFSVANVDDEKVVHVCERLKESETAFGWELD